VFWAVSGSALAVILLGWTVYSGIDLLAHGRETQTWVIVEPVSTLVVDQSGDGKVHVIGAPVDEITVRAHISEGLRSTDYGRQVVGDVLTVSSSCPIVGGIWCSVDYEIEVPVGTDVRIRNSSSIRVENLAGDVDARTGSGSIEVSGLSGLVQIWSNNGSVRATGMRSEVVEAGSENGSVRVTMEVPPRSVIARSHDGAVEVLVPRTDDTYSVDVDSDFGSQTVDVLTDPRSERRLTARTSNGSARVGYVGT